MPSHFSVYVGVVIAIALLPGPDTAVVTKNALIHGRGAALGSAIGVNVGLTVWTVATALGVASLLKTSETIYTTLKLIGALYLIWIGARAIWDSRRATAGPGTAAVPGRTIDGRRGFNQGVISNLANPKVAIFFTSLLPQFVSPGGSALIQMLLLGRGVHRDQRHLDVQLRAGGGAHVGRPQPSACEGGDRPDIRHRADRRRHSPGHRTALSRRTARANPAKDLKQDHSQCTLAYWHQPTFSSTASPSTSDSAEGQTAGAWWKLLYQHRATLILNGHDHVYSRFTPMDPAGNADPRHGIREFIIGTGGESLDTVLPDTPNLQAWADQYYGTMKFTLGPGWYKWDYESAMESPTAPSGTPPTYSDTGAGVCNGPGGIHGS